jgi:hypothetical protein
MHFTVEVLEVLIMKLINQSSNYIHQEEVLQFHFISDYSDLGVEVRSKEKNCIPEEHA